MSISRRGFLRQSLAVSAGFCGFSRYLLQPHRALANPLVGGNPWLELPPGFSAAVISRQGETMADGLLVPGEPDGMGTFLVRGKTVIVRNHEISPNETEKGAFGNDNRLLARLAHDDLFDFGHGRNPGLGGTTTLIYDEKAGKVERQFLSLAGTHRNCAGGVTPWGSWLSCEEDVTAHGADNETSHGYVFEVPAASNGLVPPLPLTDMGRFFHEAACVNPRSGFIYQTEDDEEGLFYRFIPHSRQTLRQGGTLQALKISGQPGFDSRNRQGPALAVGQQLEVEWITLDHVDPVQNDLRLRGRQQGAAVFARGEGMWFGNGELFFTCTSGGKAELGQVFRYIPSVEEGSDAEFSRSGKLELFAESTDREVFKHCDNLTIAPWGDVIFCEDSDDAWLRGITADGRVYNLARNIHFDSELAGVCFSPSGNTLFVNIQDQGLTLAVTGPWAQFAAGAATGGGA